MRLDSVRLLQPNLGTSNAAPVQQAAEDLRRLEDHGVSLSRRHLLNLPGRTDNLVPLTASDAASLIDPIKLSLRTPLLVKVGAEPPSLIKTLADLQIAVGLYTGAVPAS